MKNKVGKGSGRRPSFVNDAELAERWKNIHKSKPKVATLPDATKFKVAQEDNLWFILQWQRNTPLGEWVKVSQAYESEATANGVLQAYLNGVIPSIDEYMVNGCSGALWMVCKKHASNLSSSVAISSHDDCSTAEKALLQLLSTIS